MHFELVDQTCLYLPPYGHHSFLVALRHVQSKYMTKDNNRVSKWRKIEDTYKLSNKILTYEQKFDNKFILFLIPLLSYKLNNFSLHFFFSYLLSTILKHVKAFLIAVDCCSAILQ